MQATFSRHVVGEAKGKEDLRNVHMDLAMSSSEVNEDPDSFQSVKKKRKKKGKQQHRNTEAPIADISSEDDRNSLENKRQRKVACDQKAAGNSSKQNDMEDDNDEEEDERTPVGRRKRLYFPNNLEMDYHNKLRWAVRLYKEYHEFEVLFKEGRHRPYITVKDDKAVEHLSTIGFENVVLEIPRDSDKYTKIIVFEYPVYMDPQDLLVDERIVWAKRREVSYKGKKEVKPQLIALIRGETPGRIFVPCIGYRKVAVYHENPILCFKCSKWGHMAFKCQNGYRCRYCSKNHDSTECGDKIKENIRITPKCCNCGEGHNASSWLCKKRPLVEVPKTRNTAPAEFSEARNQQHNGPIMTTPVGSVWDQRREEAAQRRREAAVNDNASNNVNLAPDVISALCKTIEGLKKVILEMQSQIVTICNSKEMNSVGESLKKVSLEDQNISVQGGSENANNAFLKDTNQVDLDTKGRDCSGVRKNSDQGERGDYNHLVKCVTGLLDSVVEYMQNPKEDLKSNVLRSAQHFREKIHKNGGN